jgi:hypothetical protein
MCLQNAMQLRIFPMEAIVKVGDTLPDIEEGLNAGMWTIGLAKTGNEVGLNEAEIAKLPADVLENQTGGGLSTHAPDRRALYVVDGIARDDLGCYHRRTILPTKPYQAARPRALLPGDRQQSPATAAVVR